MFKQLKELFSTAKKPAKRHPKTNEPKSETLFDDKVE